MISLRISALLILFVGITTSYLVPPATKLTCPSGSLLLSDSKYIAVTGSPSLEAICVTLDDLPPPYSSQIATKPPQIVPIPGNASLQLPEGFTVNVFAEGFDSPRWLALTPTGDVLVSETNENTIQLLKDSDGDGIAETVQQFAGPENGVNISLGMAFSNGYFYLGNTKEVRRYNYTSGQQQLNDTGEKITDLPGVDFNQHWTRNVVISPDEQLLYVSIGSEQNIDEEDPPRASIQVMNLDGTNNHTFVFGTRNPVGLDFHPVTKDLYVVVNERDDLGDDLVPDYFTRIQEGEYFGWPYAYLSPNNLDPREMSGGKSLNPELANKTVTPDVLFQAHTAPLGMKFYTGNTFPEHYRNGAFVASHGSWNRNQGTGYKIVFVPFDGNSRPGSCYEDFMTGFLLDPSIPSTWGRPAGLLVMPDGSLLLADDGNGRIYRIQYEGSQGYAIEQ
jgi:glucose/arabinose dehydrogenase